MFKKAIIVTLFIFLTLSLGACNKGESKLKTIDELTSMLQLEIKFNQYDLIVIDNLMSILSVTAAEKYEQQADFMQRLCDLAKIYNTHIILVLHPNKTYTKGSDMDFEQISGSSDIYNKADNIISVVREYDKEKINQGINGHLDIIKNRYYGDLVKANIYFEKETARSSASRAFLDRLWSPLARSSAIVFTTLSTLPPVSCAAVRRAIFLIAERLGFEPLQRCGDGASVPIHPGAQAPPPSRCAAPLAEEGIMAASIRPRLAFVLIAVAFAH
jgi:hypothetical protein